MKPIKFSYLNRVYNLEFNHLRIMQIKGESAVGKSLFTSDFEKQKDIDKTYENSIVIDYTKKEMLRLITDNSNYDYVIIDNADVILGDTVIQRIKNNILTNNKTHWVIIGRNFFPCVLSIGSVGELKKEKKNGKYYYSMTYSSGV